MNGYNLMVVWIIEFILLQIRLLLRLLMLIRYLLNEGNYNLNHFKMHSSSTPLLIHHLLLGNDNQYYLNECNG